MTINRKGGRLQSGVGPSLLMLEALHIKEETRLMFTSPTPILPNLLRVQFSRVREINRSALELRLCALGVLLRCRRGNVG